MVRGRSEFWNHFTIEGKRTTCNFCGKQAYKNPSRMPFHLTKCPRCPESVKERMLTEVPKSLTKRSSSPSQCIVESNNSSNDFENGEPEVEVVNENEVENVIFPSSPYTYTSIKHVDKFKEDKPDDEFTLFGNSVAHKLRNINNSRARVIAQYYINTVLFRAEMTNFNENVILPTQEEFSLFDSVNQESSSVDQKFKPNEAASGNNSCSL